MTMRISLTYGPEDANEVTIDLMAGGYVVNDGYYPEVSSDPEQSVTEQLTVLVTSSSQSDLQAKIRALELAFEHARQHPRGIWGTYIHFAVDSSMDTWRSRITDGLVMLDSKLDNRWRVLKALVRLTIVRAPWWETEEPQTVNINSMATASYGATASVSNCQDATLGNYVFLESVTQDLGVLPTPAILEIKNSTNDADKINKIYVGHFATLDGFFPPMGNSTGLVLEAMGTEDATCSNGEYSALSWTGTTEQLLKTWTTFLTKALSTGAGHYFKLIARFRDTFAYTDLYLKAKLLLGTDVIAETRWTLMEAGKELQMIGSMKVTPFKALDYTGIEDLSMTLSCKRAAGDGTINLDYIALLAQDSWRHYGAIGDGLAYNKTLVDDPYQESLLTTGDSEGSSKVTHLVESGNPILLLPKTRQALYFLHDVDDDSAPVARTMTIGIKCRPRRRTV